MVRILLLPLLQIPSGHQHVADSIIAHLDTNLNFHCEKIEFLSYCYPQMERIISTIYIQTINKIPTLYSSLYKTVARNDVGKKNFPFYDWLFLKKLEEILEEKKPDLVICTHSFPSYLINRLKEKRRWHGKAINIYTDYFLNNHWGVRMIDYHFVPTSEVKEQLMTLGVEKERIFLTGIPIHPHLQRTEATRHTSRPVVLISAGSMGCGSMKALLTRLKPKGGIHYKVLCGKNEALLQYVRELNNPFIEPLPYITSKEKINQLYDEATCILTKPGGVTLSECLYKQVPIVIFQALPGQEEYNLQYFKKKKLVYHLANWKQIKNIEKILYEQILSNQHHLRKQYSHFSEHLDKRSLQELIEKISS